LGTVSFNSDSEALTPNVAVFGDRALKEGMKVKLILDG
jgi:hypothetical protein